MSIRGRIILLIISLLSVIAAGLVLGRPPWPGAGDTGKLRMPDSTSCRTGIVSP